MTNIRISGKAIADLDEIWLYTLREWSEEQASTYYRQLVTAIHTLVNTPPFLMKNYDVVKTGLLGLKVGHHIIFFKKQEDGDIVVDRILHERMDVLHQYGG
ncbi:MAG: type II toxin-antitoxin system RelE/ParE family toxin [Bacteroidales bacterium]|nr:type II toxin-antitoxin system RelE/ParE family toxin [Bacteroidales bacterium]